MLGVLEPAKNRMVLTKVKKNPDLLVVIQRNYVMTPSSNNEKVEEMWEAQFNEDATATRREIDNLAPKSG